MQKLEECGIFWLKVQEDVVTYMNECDCALVKSTKPVKRPTALDRRLARNYHLYFLFKKKNTLEAGNMAGASAI